MAPSSSRPGENPAAAGVNPQEGEAQEGRGRSGGVEGQAADSFKFDHLQQKYC